jgi:hypothetical protein
MGSYSHALQERTMNFQVYVDSGMDPFFLSFDNVDFMIYVADKIMMAAVDMFEDGEDTEYNCFSKYDMC